MTYAVSHAPVNHNAPPRTKRILSCCTYPPAETPGTPASGKYRAILAALPTPGIQRRSLQERFAGVFSMFNGLTRKEQGSNRAGIGSHKTPGKRPAPRGGWDGGLQRRITGHVRNPRHGPWPDRHAGLQDCNKLWRHHAHRRCGRCRHGPSCAPVAGICSRRDMASVLRQRRFPQHGTSLVQAEPC